MIAIKLQRIGKKHQPSYRIVVAPARSKMAAPPIADLGSYNSSSKAFNVKSDEVTAWMKKGAQPTTTVHNLLVSHKVIEAPKKQVRMKKAKPAEKA